jgi:hypothetical protein
MMAIGGLIANLLLTRRILSTTTVRQLFNTVGQSFIAFIASRFIN